jgi:hypothetical protein
MNWIAGLQRGMHSQEFQCSECKHWICHEVKDDLPLSCEKCGARKEIMNNSTCPLCGVDTPHNHSPAEQLIYKNGVKAGSIAAPQQAIPAESVLLNNMTNSEENIKAYLKQSVPKGMAEAFRSLMTSPNLNEIVSRFLSWKLPSDFSPDGGIKVDKHPMSPIYNIGLTGTNLFNADQAKAMFEYVLAGAHIELSAAPTAPIDNVPVAMRLSLEELVFSWRDYDAEVVKQSAKHGYKVEYAYAPSTQL